MKSKETGECRLVRLVVWQVHEALTRSPTVFCLQTTVFLVSSCPLVPIRSHGPAAGHATAPGPGPRGPGVTGWSCGGLQG